MGLQELVPYFQGQLELGACWLRQEALEPCWLELVESCWLELVESCWLKLAELGP